MKKQRLVVTLVPLLTAGFLAGCGRGDEEKREEDSSKTQLKVAAIRSGVEDQWLNDLAKKFMKKYEDYSFEEGKKGIQIWIDGDKTAFNGDQLNSIIKSDDHQIYCVENVKYNTFLSPEIKVLNLKDIVNIKGSDGNAFYTDEKSIYDRMDDQFKTAFTKSGGDIYMLPYYESFASFQYDRDVFNGYGDKIENGKSFYLKRSDLVIEKDPTAADYYADVKNPGDVAPLFDDFDINDSTVNVEQFFCDKNEDASHRNYGPDGLQGTFDDGLPQTFTEFKVLLSYMKKNGFTPILGNKTYNYYFADMLSSVWANEEGIDNMNLNFSWNGAAKDLLKIEGGKIVKNADGSFVHETKAINDKTSAIELHRQEGVYRALELAKIIVDSQPHKGYEFTEAQSMFIKTKFNSAAGFDYGLICDGNWWENESKGTFAPDRNDPKNRLNRNFSFFTFPKSSSDKWDTTRGDMTYYNINSSTCFMNKNLETKDAHLMEAAKAFFLYINSNEGMSYFTTSTSITRPFEYSITKDDSAKIAPYGKDMMELRKYFNDKTGKTKNYNSCTTYPLTDLVAANEGIVHKYEWNFQLNGLNKEKAIPVDVMLNNPQYQDIEKYFVDSYNYTKSIIH